MKAAEAHRHPCERQVLSLHRHFVEPGGKAVRSRELGQVSGARLSRLRGR
jgi:hypothetical protein